MEWRISFQLLYQVTLVTKTELSVTIFHYNGFLLKFLLHLILKKIIHWKACYSCFKFLVPPYILIFVVVGFFPFFVGGGWLLTDIIKYFYYLYPKLSNFSCKQTCTFHVFLLKRKEKNGQVQEKLLRAQFQTLMHNFHNISSKFACTLFQSQGLTTTMIFSLH